MGIHILCGSNEPMEVAQYKHRLQVLEGPRDLENLRIGFQ